MFMAPLQLVPSYETALPSEAPSTPTQNCVDGHEIEEKWFHESTLFGKDQVLPLNSRMLPDAVVVAQNVRLEQEKAVNALVRSNGSAVLHLPPLYEYDKPSYVLMATQSEAEGAQDRRFAASTPNPTANPALQLVPSKVNEFPIVSSAMHIFVDAHETDPIS
jgi:hypothetical protein